MAYKADFKTTFEPSRVIQPIYTGGPVGLSQDGQLVATCLGDEAVLTNLTDGTQLARIEGDGEPITSLSLTPDGLFLILCSRSLSMRIYALRASEDSIEPKLLRTLKPHAGSVVTSTVDDSSTLLATGGADGVVKVWDIREGFTTHTFHGHSGIISALLFFQTDTPTERQAQQAKGKKHKQRNGNVEQVEDERTLTYRLASGGEDGKVRIWNLHKRKSEATLDSHVSVVRGLDYSVEKRLLLSGSRDKTVIMWDPSSWQARATLPVLEVVESVGFVEQGQYLYTGGENGRLRIWSAETGSEVTEEQEAGVETEAIVQVLYHTGLPFVLSIHADQVLILHSLEPLSSVGKGQIQALPALRQISGTHDEIIDLAYIGRQKNFLALATNLEDVRIISLGASTGSYFGADVASLKSHTDIIITMATDWSGHWLITGSKDNAAKLWRLDPENDSYECQHTFTGHAESIGAASLPSSTPQKGSAAYENPLEHPPTFVITGSTDKTVKKWDVPKQGNPARAKWTRKAHDKDINAIATSYSTTAPLFASASQDRTVKIWDVDSGETVAVLRGHKRGVWSVAFSPPSMPTLSTTSEGSGGSGSRGMILTGSGDKTVRIWSLTDYSCIRTFEGHVNSVLKVVWLPVPSAERDDGRQRVKVASAAGDGLVKVWDAQDGECAATLDNHIDRVWALAVKPEALLSSNEAEAQDVEMANGESASEAKNPMTLVSGSADSTLTFWVDTTASSARKATSIATARVEQDQKLQNHIRAAEYREAIVLALQLNHPKRLLELFTAVVDGEREEGSLIGKRAVDEVLSQLSDSQLWALLRRCRDWNANARTYHVAQRILWTILHVVPKERLLNLRSRRKAPIGSDADGAGANGDLAGAMAALTTQDKAANKESVKDVVDALKAYTERHHGRLDKMGEERFVLAWALQMMEGAGKDVSIVKGTV